MNIVITDRTTGKPINGSKNEVSEQPKQNYETQLPKAFERLPEQVKEIKDKGINVNKIESEPAFEVDTKQEQGGVQGNKIDDFYKDKKEASTENGAGSFSNVENKPIQVDPTADKTVQNTIESYNLKNRFSNKNGLNNRNYLEPKSPETIIEENQYAPSVNYPAAQQLQEQTSYTYKNYQTAEDVANDIENISNLANKSSWTDKDKETVKQILKVAKLNDFSNYYDGDSQKIYNAREVYNKLYNKNNVGTSIIGGFWKGIGGQSLTEGTAKVVDTISKAFGGNTEVLKQVEEINDLVNEATNMSTGRKVASGVAEVAGNLALFSAVGDVITSAFSNIVKVTKTGDIVAKTGKGLTALQTSEKFKPVLKYLIAGTKRAATFGASEMIQNIGNVAKGYKDEKGNTYTFGNYLKDAGVSSLGGFANGIAQGLTSVGLGNLLSKNTLMTPFKRFVQTTLSSTAGADANILTQYALKKNMTGKELGVRLATAFGWSVLAGAFDTALLSKQSQADYENLVKDAIKKYDYVTAHNDELSEAELQSHAKDIYNTLRTIRAQFTSSNMTLPQEQIDQLLNSIDWLTTIYGNMAGMYADVDVNSEAGAKVVGLISGDITEAVDNAVNDIVQTTNVASEINAGTLADIQQPTTPPVSTGVNAGTVSGVGTLTPKAPEVKKDNPSETKTSKADTQLTETDKADKLSGLAEKILGSGIDLTGNDKLNLGIAAKQIEKVLESEDTTAEAKLKYANSLNKIYEALGKDTRVDTTKYQQEAERFNPDTYAKSIGIENWKDLAKQYLGGYTIFDYNNKEAFDNLISRIRDAKTVIETATEVAEEPKEVVSEEPKDIIQPRDKRLANYYLGQFENEAEKEGLDLTAYRKIKDTLQADDLTKENLQKLVDILIPLSQTISNENAVSNLWNVVLLAGLEEDGYDYTKLRSNKQTTTEVAKPVEASGNPLSQTSTEVKTTEQEYDEAEQKAFEKELEEANTTKAEKPSKVITDWESNIDENYIQEDYEYNDKVLKDRVKYDPNTKLTQAEMDRIQKELAVKDEDIEVLLKDKVEKSESLQEFFKDKHSVVDTAKKLKDVFGISGYGGGGSRNNYDANGKGLEVHNSFVVGKTPDGTLKIIYGDSKKLTWADVAKIANNIFSPEVITPTETVKEGTNGEVLEEVPNGSRVLQSDENRSNDSGILDQVQREANGTTTQSRGKTAEASETERGQIERTDDQLDRSGTESGSSSGTDKGADLSVEDEKAKEKLEKATQETIVEKEEKSSSILNKQNFVIKDSLDLPTGEKARFDANIEAIKIVKQLKTEDRLATPEEQTTLSKYVGWGGLANFVDGKNESYPEWAEKSGHPKEYKQLKELVSEEEFKSIQASTNNAHYTAIDVIKAIYNGLTGLGFKGGNILEPSAGTGNFIGSAPTYSRPTKWTGVELDTITGDILHYLYPQSDIRIQGFETANIADNYYDAAISNVPFGDYAIYDKKYPKTATSSIHNYFFAKSLDKVREGGIVCFITSRYTLDSNNRDFRKYISDRANLVGAIRLPETSFKDNANTSVVTDIIVLQKRAPKTDYSGEAFINVDWHRIGQNGYDSATYNEYFDNHPEMVLGTATVKNGMYGRGLTYTPLENAGTLKEQIEKAFTNIKAEIKYPEANAAEKTNIEVREKTKAGVKNGSLVKKDGKIYKNQNGELVEEKGLKTDEVKALGDILGIRDGARDLFNALQNGSSTEIVKTARKELNNKYDTFVKANGNLHSVSNKKLVLKDADAPFIFSLETPDGKGYKKADIFTKDTIKPNLTVTHVDTINEGLIASMNKTGLVDVNYIASLMGRDTEEVKQELINNGLVFKQADGTIQSKEEYLSGNVRVKLKEAEALVGIDKDFEHNIEALKLVVPKDVEAQDIIVKPGATWIPNETYERFVMDILDIYPKSWKRDVVVEYQPSLGEYKVEVRDNYAKKSAQNLSEYGTDRRSFIEILKRTMNNQSLIVKDKIDDTHYVVNPEATAAAQEKQTKILTEFQKWVWEDEKRCQELGALYNDTLNCLADTKYDGSNLVVNGMRPGLTPRPHQMAAVWRVLFGGGSTLLDHVAGAGKTMEIAMACMKLRELGLVNKPIIVCPKHLVNQWGQEFLDYFPAAKINVLPEKAFSKSTRKVFANSIATGDYDAVIMSYEQLSSVPMSKEAQANFYQEQLSEIMEALQSAKSDKDSLSVKALEKKRKQLDVKLKKLGDIKTDEDNITFEELGADALFVDEAHNFKNLFYNTRLINVSGLGNPTGSKRAFDLYMKTKYLQKLNGGRGVVFATATPVMNSVSEMYIMQKYLQEDTLRSMNIYSFDAWVNNFGSITTELELKPSGTGYQKKQILAKYNNIPELELMFHQFADVVRDISSTVKIPPMVGGKYININTKPEPFQTEYLKQLEQRYDRIRSGGVDPSEDNALKITSEGKKLSLDPRLLDPTLPFNPEGKIAALVNKVKDVYDRYNADKGTQLVFLDMGTPKGKDKNDKADIEIDDEGNQIVADNETAEEKAERMKLYADVKNRMIKAGIPANEIAFIHDADTQAKKGELFDNMNSGKVRVLIGSTSKMSTGMNVQERGVAIHFPNPPWRPGDLDQSLHRFLRQGNVLYNEDKIKGIEVYAYTTESTLDARLWDTLERKARFISQVQDNAFTGRDSDGDSSEALSYAELKAIASGSPLIKEQIEITQEITKLERLEVEHNKEVSNAKKELQNVRSKLKTNEDTASRLERDIKRREDVSGDKFKLTVDGSTHVKRQAAGEQLIKIVRKNYDKEAGMRKTKKIGDFAGFDLLTTNDDYLVLAGSGEYFFEIVFDTDAEGLIQSLEAKLRNMPKNLETVKDLVERDRKQIKKYEDIINNPFEKSEVLAQKRQRLAEIMLELNPPEDNAEGYDTGDDEDNDYFALPIYDEPETEEPSVAKQVRAAMEKGKAEQASKKNVGYHAGDLGKAEYYANQMGSNRDTGHFGTGTYFVGDKNKVGANTSYGDRPLHEVDFSEYKNLYKPSGNRVAYDLHDSLRVLDNYYYYLKDIASDVKTVSDYANAVGINTIADLKGEKLNNYINDNIQKAYESADAILKHIGEDPIGYKEFYNESGLKKEDPFDKELKRYQAEGLTFDEAYDKVATELEEAKAKFKSVVEQVGWRESSRANQVLNLVDDLYKGLEQRHSKEQILKAVDKTDKYITQMEQKPISVQQHADSPATVFMKALGYNGVEVRHLNQDMDDLSGLDNTTYGSVIYDLNNKTQKPVPEVQKMSGELFTPKAPTPKSDATRVESYDDIAREMFKHFGVALVRGGNFRRKTAEGYYERGRATVRTKDQNSLYVDSHELGHHFDRKYALSDNFATELEKVAEQFDFGVRKAYNNDKEKLKREALAEFVRLYLVNPAGAEEFVDGTDFYTEFEKAISTEDKKALKDFGSRIRTIIGADSVVRAKSTIRHYGEKKKDIRTIQDKIDDAYTTLVDENYPIKVMVDKVEKLSGKKIEPHRDSYILAKQLDKGGAIANDMIKNGLHRPNDYQRVSKSMQEILAPVKKHMEDFNVYLKTKDALDLYKYGKKVFPTDFSEQDLSNMVVELDQKYPEFEATANELYQYWEDFERMWLVDTGHISNTTFEMLRALYPHYVPKFRFTDKSIEKNGKQGGNALKRMSYKGSDRETYAATESFMYEMDRIVRTEMRRQINLQIRNLYNDPDSDIAEAVSMFIAKDNTNLTRNIYDARVLKSNLADEMVDNIVKNLSTEQKRKLLKGTLAEKQQVIKEANLEVATDVIENYIDNFIEYYTPKKSANGEDQIIIPMAKTDEETGEDYDSYEVYRVIDPALYNALANRNTHELHGIIKILAGWRRAFTALTTGSNPLFALTSNIWRDAGQAFVMGESGNPVQYTKDWAKAIVDIIKKSDMYLAYKSMGGSGESIFSEGRDYFATYESKNAVQKAIRTLIAKVEDFNDLVETAPRLAEFKRVVKEEGLKGRSEEDALLLGARAGAELTTDFSQRGSSEVLDSIVGVIPFSRAGINGLDNLYKAFSGNFTRDSKKTNAEKSKIIMNTIAKAVISLTIPTILLAIAHRKDEEYNKLPEFYKQNYWIFNKEWFTRNPEDKGQFIRIPKPRELGWLFSSTLESAFFEAVDSEDDHGKALIDSFVDTFIPSFDTVFAPFIDASRNTTWSGGTIVSESFDELMKGGYFDQVYDDTTSRIAVILAKLLPDIESLGVINTPKGIDYILKQTTGVFGQVLLPLTTPSDEGLLSSLRKKNMVDTTYSNKYVDLYYNIKNLQSGAREANDTKVYDENMYNLFNKTSKDIIEQSIENGVSIPEDSILRELMKYKNVSEKGTVTYGISPSKRLSMLWGEIREYNNDRSLTKTERKEKIMEARKEINEISQAMVEVYRQYTGGDVGELETPASRYYNEAVEIDYADSDNALLPTKLDTAFETSNKTIVQLTASQYEQYQQDYEDNYWRYVDKNFGSAKNNVEKAAILKASKTVARERAKNNIINNSTDYFDKFKGSKATIKDEDLIMYKAKVDVANDDKSLKQEDYISIIESLNLNGYESYLLFHSKYESDKNNPWRAYKN